MPYADHEARRARARERYAANPEVKRKAIESAARVRAARTTEVKRRYRQGQRARWVAAGLTQNGTPRKLWHGEHRSRWIASQSQWRAWLKDAPDWWMDYYFGLIGEPWRNPRLTDAQQYALRYRLDAAFAQKERERTSHKRFRQPGYAAQWAKDGTRWYRAAQSDDGSITPELLKALRDETHCAYCHRFTPRRERHLDHVMPLARSGAHSADNLVMACGACNRAKRDKLPLEWLIRITHQQAASDAPPSACVGETGRKKIASPAASCEPAPKRCDGAVNISTGCAQHNLGPPRGSIEGSSRYFQSLAAGGPPAFIHSAR